MTDGPPDNSRAASGPGDGPAVDPHLATEDLNGDLRVRSVHGGAVIMLGQASKLLLTIAATAALARLIEPADFGLFAMVTAITNFIARFRNLGLSGATVQRAEVTHAQISTLFWINVGFGTALGLIVVAVAPLVSAFYDEPRLTAITCALAVTFPLSGLTVQHQALLRRRMRFGAFAVVDVLALLVSIAAAVVAAYGGLRYWALVLQQGVLALGLAVGVWIACGWRPGPPMRHAGVRSMVAFGGNLTGAELLNAAVRQLDKMLIGRCFGKEPLGFYSKAFQLLLLPIQQIGLPVTQVAVSTLSRLQNDPPRFRAFYCQGLQVMAAAGMPIVVFMFVVAEDVILTVLGPRWGETVPLFRMLAPAAFVGSFNMATGWLYVSLGQANRQLRWVLFSSVVIAVAIVVGLQWGPLGVAAGFSIAVCGLRPFGLMYCVRTTPVTLWQIVGMLWQPAATAAASGLLLYLFTRTLPAEWSALPRLVAEVGVYAGGYAVAWLAVPGGPRTVRGLIALLMQVRRGGTLNGSNARQSESETQ